MGFDVSTNRLACVYLPAFRLQLLLRRNPLWRNQPVCVVADPKVQASAEIIALNRNARRAGLRCGMRLAEARTLANQLHADFVHEEEIRQGTQTVWQMLLKFTPVVEPDDNLPGVFWLDPNGLGNFYASFTTWGESIWKFLRAQDLFSAVVVGFNRYLAYCLACSRYGVNVPTDADNERILAEKSSLSQLNLPIPLLRSLALLKIETLGSLLSLPLAELRLRFGEDVENIYNMSNSKQRTPFKQKKEKEVLEKQQEIQPPDDDVNRLIFVIKNMLTTISDDLHRRRELFSNVHVALQLTHKTVHKESLRPATPTLNERIILDLIRLRLSQINLVSCVENIKILVDTVPENLQQLTLLANKPRRDVHAAALALAKVRATFGDKSVRRAHLHNAYLPEFSFSWKDISQVRLPIRIASRSESHPRLIRQFFSKPVYLKDLKRSKFGKIQTFSGPYRYSHSWWDNRLERDYFYLETQTDDLLWVYHDNLTKRWYLHGLLD